MNDGSKLLREALAEAKVTQTELARISGVKQPSISQFLADRVQMSDAKLDSLLSCLGFRLDVVRSAHRVELDRSHRRSWLLHRQLATHLTSADVLYSWLPTIYRNLQRLESGTRGEPHTTNLRRWRRLAEESDLAGVRRALTGLDTESVAMREVSPLAGLLPQDERTAALRAAAAPAGPP